MTGNWLQAYLATSIRRNICTKIYCTTCGAMEFRRGAVSAWTTTYGLPQADGLYLDGAVAIAKALSEVRPLDPRDYKLVSAARCLLFDICKVIGQPAAVEALGTSWGADVLRDMQNHYNRKQEARRAAAEHEQNLRKAREENARLRQERHRQRLAAKALRDAEWRAKHGKSE